MQALLSRRTLFLVLVGLWLFLLIAIVHGQLVWENLSVSHWEDELAFAHVETHVRDWVDCFRKPNLWPGLYRPLTVNCYYHAGARFFNNRLEIYHALNVIFYGLNGLLLFWLVSRLPRFQGKRVVAFLAASLWVTRFAHVEILLNTVEFQALLSVLFSLLTLGIAAGRLQSFVEGGQSRGNLWLATGVTTFLALLSKESALVLPLLLAVLGWFYGQVSRARGALRASFGSLAATLLWAGLFVSVFRGTTDHEETGFIYTTLLESILQNYAGHLLDFANFLVWPLSNWVMADKVSALIVQPLLYWSVGILLLITGVGAIAIHWFRNGLPVDLGRYLTGALFGVLWFGITSAPFVLFSDRLFMRYSYFGHAGVAITCASLFTALAQHLWGLRQFIQWLTPSTREQ